MKTKFRFSKYREFILLAIIVIMSLLIQVGNSNWLTLTNMLDVLTDTSILVMLSFGMMLVIVSGGIDLSVAAILSFTCMLAPAIMLDYPGTSALVATAIAVLCGGAMGLVNGLLIAKGKLIPIIATLGMMNIYRGLNIILIDKYGGWITSSQMPQEFMDLSRVSFLGIHIYIWFMLAMLGFFLYLMKQTKFGRRVYAVGSNADAVRISGVDGSAIQLWVYTIIGLIAGFCGPLWAGRYSFAQGDSAMGFEMFVIASCVIGGVSVNGGIGKVLGVFMGALLIGIIKNALPMLMVSQFWQLALQGVIILAAVILNAMVLRRSRGNILKERKI